MSHPQPPQRQPTPNESDRYAKALHNTALCALVACPALILIPPRKLDFYTFSLGGATLFSANFLIREQTGRSVWQHISQPRQQHVPMSYSSVPPTEQANLQRELQTAENELQRIRQDGASVTAQVQSQRDAWKAQREAEINEDVEDGKGFGDMIMDQIWEVWNWGKPKDDEDEG